jgi:hypothetical protein
MSPEPPEPHNGSRKHNVPDDYYEVTDGLGEDNIDHIKFGCINTACEREGYGGLFEAGITYSQLYPQEGIRFVQSGGFQRLVDTFLKPSTSPSAGGCPRKPESEYRLALTKPLESIYTREWSRIISDKTFKIGLGQYSLEHIDSFSFTTIHESFKEHAPCLISLTHTLANPPKAIPPRDHEAHMEKLRLWVVGCGLWSLCVSL